MVFAPAWDVTSPPGTQDINLGDNRITEMKDQLDDRLWGQADATRDDIFDISGTRNTESEPQELRPGLVDVVALDRGAGGYNAAGRACTYIERATLGANYIITSPENVWRSTGLTITIPGTILAADINALGDSQAHVNSAVLSTSDYAIEISVQISVHVEGTGNSSNFVFYRIRNTTNNVVIGPGSTEALGAAGTEGVHGRIQSQYGAAGTDRDWLCWNGLDTTGRTAATTYSVEACGTADFDPGHVAGIYASAAVPAQITARVFKR